MAVNPIDSGVTSHVATLVRATWGDSSSADYCLYTDDLSITVPSEGVVAFSARQAMSVDYGEQHGGVKDSPCRVTLPNDDALIVLLSSLCAPVEITLAEVDPDTHSSYRETFFGQVSKCTLNARGREGVAEIEIAGLKSRLDIRLGMVADQACQLRYGKAPCPVNLAALTESSVTIDSVSGRTLTVSDAVVTSKSSRYWHRGFITVDGLRIMVRNWESGGTFEMMDLVPSAWAGASADFAPGCMKTIEWCRTDGAHVSTQGSAEEYFSGIGIAMLDYNPQYEKGSG